ncbi:Proteophosphoglycan 5 [Rhodotorula toruloides ATCC 204091]|uniref:non-specific serine/threonine protein kinase n=1 Tax=Rhodotorula toruloides TaxID=5286 RepID=A0A2T0A1H9_RHOTO|nr:Proteophosphoglycan 5 [Rhodotorula toruloides ATCC 204091]PRQ71843.1 Proteophosphoglycan 5 [Rhodotorula toruloides]
MGDAARSRLMSPEPMDGVEHYGDEKTNRDVRMRGMSEEPQHSDPVTIPTAANRVDTSSSFTASPGPSPSVSPTSGAASASVSVQRNPSLRARDAFSRLRIGSFGGTIGRPPPPTSSSTTTSPAPASPTLSAGSSAEAASLDASTSSLPRRQNSTGTSKAASFLSAFRSPPSSVGGRSPSPPLRDGQMPSFSSALPLRGDERGYKLVTKGEDGEEYEYELGKELGRGGMGLVREAVRRRRRTCDKGKGKEREDGGDSAVQSDCDPDLDDEIEDDAIKVAVKIIPRQHHASLPFLQGTGAGAPAGNGIPGSTLPSGLVHHLHPSPSPSPGTPQGRRNASSDSPMRTDSYLSTNSSSNTSLSFRHPSRDRAAAVERARSASSPIRPGMITRGLTLTAVEASPLPSPSLQDGTDGPDAAMMGTSAPEHEDGFFAARARSDVQPGYDDDHPPEMDLQNPSDLLDLLLQRELSIWRQLSGLPSSSTAYAAEHPTRWTGKGGHPHIVALIGSHRTNEFDYVFMPLAEGGTLLEYLNNPDARREASPAGRASSRSGSRAASRGRAQKPRPRGSIPIAGSLSPPGGLAAQSGPKGLPLDEAGETFAQIVEAVRWMHEEAGVAHRDLKLENVVGCWSTDSGPAADFEAPMPASQAQEGGRGRSRSRRRGSQMDEEGPPQMMRIKRKRKRVWKLADFGLAEVIPPQNDSPSSPTSPVHDVQPLAALARAGSLNRPPGERGGGGNGLGSSIGPGASAGSGQSSSAFLPHPHRNPPVAFPQHHASPTAASTSHPAHNSPLSALLHPVGSLPYSSPEALRSPVPIVHPSTDIWALGCVLYALVAGRLPIWEEWELRLRVKLVKGEWDVPDELDPNQAISDADRHERELALEVLKGCLEKDVEKRWTIRQVWESRWLAHIRERDAHEREQRRRNKMAHLRLQVPQSPSALSTTSSLAPSPSPTSPTATRASSRGRPATRSSSAHPGSHYGPYPPPAPSTGASHTPAASSTPTGGRQSRSRTRLATHTRSTSRSSAYAHQYGAAGSEGGEQERRERGRSERRLRWDEERGVPYPGAGRRSLSQASSSTSASYGDQTGEASGSSTPGGPGTPAEGGHAQAQSGHATRGGRRHEWDDQERLETVGEPY